MDSRKYVDMFDGEKERAASLLGKVALAQKTWDEQYTDFLTEYEQQFLNNVCHAEEINIQFFGGKGEAERKIAALSMNELSGEFPVDVLKITGNFKFEQVSHKDYMGSVLSQGIRREKIGDINAYEDGCEIWVSSDISDYIIMNLDKIRHTSVKVTKIDYDKAREKIVKFAQKNIIAASMRIDSVVASLTGCSRSKSSDIIKAGSVSVNHCLVSKVSENIDVGDIISIKKYGRYVIDDMSGTTKSGRLNLSIKKYI